MNEVSSTFLQIFNVFGKLLEKLAIRIYNIKVLKREFKEEEYSWQQKRKIYGYY